MANTTEAGRKQGVLSRTWAGAEVEKTQNRKDKEDLAAQKGEGKAEGGHSMNCGFDVCGRQRRPVWLESCLCVDLQGDPIIYPRSPSGSNGQAPKSMEICPAGECLKELLFQDSGLEEGEAGEEIKASTAISRLCR